MESLYLSVCLSINQSSHSSYAFWWLWGAIRLENYLVMSLPFHPDLKFCDSNLRSGRRITSSFPLSSPLYFFSLLFSTIVFRDVKAIILLKINIKYFHLFALRCFETISAMLRLSELFENEILCYLLILARPSLSSFAAQLWSCACGPFIITSQQQGQSGLQWTVISCNVSNCCAVDIQCMCLSLTHRLLFQLESLVFHVEVV